MSSPRPGELELTEMPSCETENTAHDGEQDVKLRIPLGTLLESIFASFMVDLVSSTAGCCCGGESWSNGTELGWASSAEGSATDD